MPAQLSAAPDSNKPDSNARNSAAYDSRTVTLHWLTAALVVCLWALGQTIDWFPKDARVAARSTHITLGVILALVLVLRFKWRFGAGGAQLPGVGPRWMQQISTLAHYGLYALLCITVLLGLSNAWVHGDSIFNLFNLPALTQDSTWRHRIASLHGLAANALLILAGLHAAAALFHYFVFKDSVLQRMRLHR